MRHNKRFSRRGGVLMIVLWVVLVIAIMPACSKKTGEETPPAEKATVSGKTQGKAPVVQDQRQEKIKQLQQIQQELIVMQSATLKKYPELSGEQEALRMLIESKMQALLKPQKVDIQQLQELQKKLQDQTLPETERATLMAEFQGKATLTRQARIDAMNDEAVQEAYKKYEAHMKELMIADHPQAVEKIASFEKIQAELQKMGAVNAAPAPSN